MRHSAAVAAARSAQVRPEIALRTYFGDVDLVDRVGGAWRALCDASDQDQPFYRPEWTSAYLRAFKPRGRLVIFAAHVDGVLTALLPLIEEDGSYFGLPMKILRAVGNVHSVRPDLVRAPGAAGDAGVDAVWEGLKAYAGWDLIDFPNTCEDGAFQRLVVLAQRDGHQAESLFSHDSARLAVPPADENPPWMRCASPRFRDQLRRNLRRVAAAGVLTVTQHRTANRAALERFYALEQSGWKGRSDSAIACHGRTRQFYDAIAHAAAEYGYLSLDFLEVDGRPISAHFGLSYRGRYFLPKAAYDEGFRSYGPGHLLVHEVLRDHRRCGLDTFDFTGRVTWDEQRWTLGTVRHVHSKIFQKNLRGSLVSFVRNRMRQGIAMMKDGAIRR